MKTRRRFIQKLTGAGIAGLLPAFQSVRAENLQKELKNYEGLSPSELSNNEEFWSYVRQSYAVSPSIINLNNGGLSPQPRVVQEAVEHYNRLCNEAPSHFMWRILDQGREPLREKLAKLAGCSPEEIAINRNTSEALETVIFGLRLNAGDEVVLGRQDYPNMMNAWRQRALREGIVLKWVDLELPSEDDNYLVEKYVEQFSERTKVVQLTHVINWTGQILPVRKIADEAHQRGIEVVCDAAHSFALLDFKIPDLGADYLGASLHKWLCAPFGSGMLWVRKGKIPRLYPLFAGDFPEGADIRKFENLGTRSFPIEQAIGHAIEFHEMIGTARKQARLHFLKKYWAEKALKLPGVSFGTSLKPAFGCAIALLKVEGLDPVDLSEQLFKDAKIHTTAMHNREIRGVRITPNVYTTTAELDKLVLHLEKIITNR